MLKKCMAIFAILLLLLQSVHVPNTVADKAQAAAYSPVMQEIMSRPYPRLMGNQWNVAQDGTFDSGDSSSKIQFVAKYLDYITLNRSGDLFLDFYQSSHDKNMGLLKLKNDIYAAASALGRRVYVIPYHNTSDVWNYESINTFPNENFWMKPDGKNIGTWDYMNNHNYWLVNGSGFVAYPGYSSSQRRFWDSRKIEVQDYWARHAKGIADQGFDGIFADNWLRSGFESPDREGVQRGWNEMGRKFKQLAPNKILIGNSPPYNLFTTRDVCMLEDRIAPTGTGDKSIPSYLNYSDQAAAIGQVCQDTFWDENQGPFETFRIPMVLLTDNVFGLTLHTKQGRNLDYQRAVIEKLGKIGYPKGARYRANGIFQRDFDLAKVLMNDTSNSVTITLPSGVYKDLNGEPVNTITLAAYRGIVLKKSGTISPPPNASIPEAPSNLAMTGVTKGTASGEYYINLAWNDNSINETAFKLYQSINSTSNYLVARTPTSNLTAYGINLGTNPVSGVYYYYLTAINDAGESQASNVVNAGIGKPLAPSDLVVSSVTKGATSGDYYINLSWKDNSANETGFRLFQSINSTSNFRLIKNPAANTVSYGVNLGAIPSAGTYYYKISSVNNSGESQPSNIANTGIGVPNAPSGLVLASVSKSTTSGNYFINLKWTDNSPNETGFRLYQSINSTSSYNLVKTPVANCTDYCINIGSTPTQGTYYYKVSAINDAGESQASNVITANINY